jgi:DNA-binding transcriptional ArsR family regulator
MSRNFAQTAALLSDPGRASMLMALLGGIALPAGELAMLANVAPQTASSHLFLLMAGNLISVEQQGRHRYYRIAVAGVADAIEALLAITPPSKTSSPDPARGRASSVGSLAYARTCYSHLAGQLAVEIADALQRSGVLLERERKLLVSKRGRSWFQQLGIAVSESCARDARFAKRCLDWTERRHHIAGRLGSAMLVRFLEQKWIAAVPSSRSVRVTLEGERQLRERLGIRVPRLG